MSRKDTYKKPDMKINGHYIPLSRKYTDVPGYKMSEAICDAMEIADRLWTGYLERVINRWEENPFDGSLLRGDSNLEAACKAKGYLGLPKEQILEAAEEHLERLAKA